MSVVHTRITRHQPQLGNISLINVEKAATKNIVLEPLSRLLSPLGRFATFFTTHPISGTLVLPKATGLGQPSGETTLGNCAILTSIGVAKRSWGLRILVPMRKGLAQENRRRLGSHPAI